MKKLLLLTLCLCLYGADDLLAADIYVDSLGGGDYVTIQEAADVAVAGDSIYIAPGTYPERVIPQNSGDATAGYIRYIGVGDVIIDGEFQRTYGISGQNLVYISIEGVKVENCKNPSLWPDGAHRLSSGIFFQYCDHMKLVDVTTFNNLDFGAYFHTCKDLAITGCHFERSYNDDPVNSSNNPRNRPAGLQLTKVERVFVDDCVFFQNQADGLRMSSSKTPALFNKDIVISNCESYENGRQGLLFFESDRVWIKDVHAHHNYATGIQVETATSNFVLQRIEANGNGRHTATSVNSNVVWAEDSESVVWPPAPGTIYQGYNSEAGIWIDDADHVLIEDCETYDNFRGLILTQCYDVIVRRNVIRENSGHIDAASGLPANGDRNRKSCGLFYGDGPTPHSHGHPEGMARVAIYNNTFYSNGHEDSYNLNYGQPMFFGDITNYAAGNGFPQHATVTDNYLLNNVFSMTRGYSTLAVSHETDFARIEGNAYDIDSSRMYVNTGGETLQTSPNVRVGYAAAYDRTDLQHVTSSGHDTKGIAGPVPIDLTTFELLGTPGVNGGTYLAKTVANTVTNGPGPLNGQVVTTSTLYVDTSAPFQHGYGIKDENGVSVQLGDWIRLSNGQIAKVTFSGGGIITLNTSVTWTPGLGVSLLYVDTSNSQVVKGMPDMGVRETDNETVFGSWNGNLGLYGANNTMTPADYDGDGIDDLSVYGGGKWFINYSSTPGGWDEILSGYGSHTPVPADYDGDGLADISIKTDSGVWFIDYAADGFGTWNASKNGWGNGTPIPGDYDGDGSTDMATLTTLGSVAIDFADNGFVGVEQNLPGHFGANAKPAIGDYDGDGISDLAARRSDGVWRVDLAVNGFGPMDISKSGYGTNAAQQILVADYDGDGHDDIGMKDENGTWRVDYFCDGYGFWNETWTGYGAPHKSTTPDLDGDGIADLTTKDASGRWYVDYSAN